MSPVNDINIPNITIPNVVSSESWIYGIPNIPSNHPPITTNIGFPIVEIPGCVKMHKDNKDHVTRMPFDHDLVNHCLLYTSPSPDLSTSRMPSSA